jgi:hypothetical protein
MKRIIFLSTNVEFFNRILSEFNSQATFELYDSKIEAVEVLKNNKEGYFDFFIWDMSTFPFDHHLGFIMANDDGGLVGSGISSDFTGNENDIINLIKSIKISLN